MNIIKRKSAFIISVLMLIIHSQVFALEKDHDKTTLDCLVKPEMYIDISSPVDGVLDSVLVNKTDSIKKEGFFKKLFKGKNKK